ncbi:hypothetical protein ACJX0J_024041, partial [Zea mays]
CDKACDLQQPDQCVPEGKYQRGGILGCHTLDIKGNALSNDSVKAHAVNHFLLEGIDLHHISKFSGLNSQIIRERRYVIASCFTSTKV